MSNFAVENKTSPLPSPKERERKAKESFKFYTINNRPAQVVKVCEKL